MIKDKHRIEESLRNRVYEEVYDHIRVLFRADGPFKGRIYFDSADDMVQEIKLRRKK